MSTHSYAEIANLIFPQGDPAIPDPCQHTAFSDKCIAAHLATRCPKEAEQALAQREALDELVGLALFEEVVVGIKEGLTLSTAPPTLATLGGHSHLNVDMTKRRNQPRIIWKMS